jgi:general stress protein YciG
MAKIDDKTLLGVFLKLQNYSAVGREMDMQRDVVRRRIVRMRSFDPTIPPTIKFTDEVKKRVAETNRARYGIDFYAKIGAKGGSLGHTGGFCDRELARRAGSIGGKKSKRGAKAQ